MDGAKMNAYRGLVGKPDEKKSLGIYSHRWEDIIKMDLKFIGEPG
jgi:hypothetical protein